LETDYTALNTFHHEVQYYDTAADTLR